jgi:hypothetical protein
MLKILVKVVMNSERSRGKPATLPVVPAQTFEKNIGQPLGLFLYNFAIYHL